MFAGLLWKAIDKQDIQINIQIEEMHGTRYVRKGPEIPRPPNTPVSPNLHVFTNLEVLQTPHYCDFYWGFIKEAW